MLLSQLLYSQEISCDRTLKVRYDIYSFNKCLSSIDYVHDTVPTYKLWGFVKTCYKLTTTAINIYIRVMGKHLMGFLNYSLWEWIMAPIEEVSLTAKLVTCNPTEGESNVLALGFPCAVSRLSKRSALLHILGFNEPSPSLLNKLI